MIIFYLNNLHVPFMIDAIDDTKIQISIHASDDPFTEMANNLKINSSLHLPLFSSFFEGIVDTINKSIQYECNTFEKDQKIRYQIVIKQS